jgi:hypothetical protein
MRAGLIVAGLVVVGMVLLGTLGRPAGEARAAANQLLTEQKCSAHGAADVAFVWTGNGLLLTEQWFDISSANSFAPGTFTGIHLAGGWVQSLTLTLDDSATFYVRLNQLNVNGQWDPSPVFTVQTIACPLASYAVSNDEERDEERDERREKMRRRGTDLLSDLEVILLVSLICGSDEADEDLQDFFDICEGEEDDD